MLENPIKDKDFIKVYTDGGCLVNPNGPGGYGVIIFFEPNKPTEFSEGFKSTTNNRMELRAFIRALKEIKEPSNIDLYTDSKYFCDAFNLKWINKWLETDWKNGTVKNIDLWKTIIELATHHYINFNWVKGHSDNIYNNRCDELATNAYNKKNLSDDIGYKEIEKNISSINKQTKKEELNMNGVPYPMKISQLEKAKGELRALLMLSFDPSLEKGGETYQTQKKLIENFIEELDNNF